VEAELRQHEGTDRERACADVVPAGAALGPDAIIPGATKKTEKRTTTIAIVPMTAFRFSCAISALLRAMRAPVSFQCVA
jgi:hypothetical protein